MKKPSRKQPQDDSPPRAFDQNIEPVPFADPSSALPSQKQPEGEQASEKSSHKGPIYEPLPPHPEKSALVEGYQTHEDWREIEVERRFPGLSDAGRKFIEGLIPETPEEAKQKERLEKQWSGNRLTQELLNWDKHEVVFESVRNDVRGASSELPLVADRKPEGPKVEDEPEVVQRYKSFESLVHNLAFYGFELLCDIAQDKDSGDMLKHLSRLARNGDLRARATVRAIANALTAWARGPTERPEEEREQRIRSSNLESQHDLRAPQYCESIWRRYVAETAGITAPDRCWIIANDIAEEERSRGEEAKQEGVRLFLQRVKQALKG